MALTGSRIELGSLGLLGAIRATETATDADIPNRRTSSTVPSWSD